MQKIEKHFTEFLSSKHKSKMITIKSDKVRWALEYEYDFVDEWETTGWILYKPFFRNLSRLYMFKGKIYEPKSFKRIRWFQWMKRFQYWMIERENQPDWAMRNKVEWHIAMGWIKIAIIVAFISMLVLMPALIAKLTDKEVSQTESAQITQEIEEEQEKATQE